MTAGSVYLDLLWNGILLQVFGVCVFFIALLFPMVLLYWAVICSINDYSTTFCLVISCSLFFVFGFVTLRSWLLVLVVVSLCHSSALFMWISHPPSASLPLVRHSCSTFPQIGSSGSLHVFHSVSAALKLLVFFILYLWIFLLLPVSCATVHYQCFCKLSAFAILCISSESIFSRKQKCEET